MDPAREGMNSSANGRNEARWIVRTIAALVLVVATGLLLRWQAGRQIVSLSGSIHETMGTLAQIVVVAPKSIAQRCVDEGLAEMDRIDRVMSDYKNDSELSRVNREAFREKVIVSEELYSILQTSVEYSRLSHGAFDITVGPLVDLWRKAGQRDQPPSEEEIHQTRSKVGYEKLQLEPLDRSVRFRVDGMRLDLGAIGKGYAVDKALEIVRRNGAKSGMVNLGGNIRCFNGSDGKDRPWVIGIRDPQDEMDYLLRLKVKDFALATSGDYMRYVVVHGQKINHILNPATSGAAGELCSVTILAPTGIQADALSTTVTVLGKGKGLALVESLADVEAILIASDDPKTLVQSSGAAPFIDF